MNIFHFFKKEKTRYGHYEDSSHKDIYEKIAHDLNSTPQRVYEIAHGKTIRSFDDEVIYEQLVQQGILSNN